MLRRKQSVKHGELARAELGESLDHALRAAGHAAEGVRTTVGPKVGPAAERVRGAAAERWSSTKAGIGPLSEAGERTLKKGAENGERVLSRSKRKAAKAAGKVAAGKAAGKAARKMADKNGKGKAGKKARSGKSKERRWSRMAGLMAGGIAVGAVVAAVVRRRRELEWQEYTSTDAVTPAGLGTGMETGAEGGVATGAEVPTPPTRTTPSTEPTNPDRPSGLS